MVVVVDLKGRIPLPQTPSKPVAPLSRLPLIDGFNRNLQLTSAGLVPQRRVLKGHRGTAGGQLGQIEGTFHLVPLA